MPTKGRLDQLLVVRGLCESREKARRVIMAGSVSVAGQVVTKPGQAVAADAVIDVRGTERFVGRGGHKLEGGLEHFGIRVSGQVAMDIGASTGGFTDCLLQRGARRVHAVDVGRGQLHWKLRTDARVVVHEGVNARHLAPEQIGEPVDLAVADVSFISLALLLPPVFALLEPDADMVALIKPQFELSAAEVGRGGIVREPDLRAKAVEKIRSFVEGSGHRWLGVVESPLPGRDGNIEFLAHLKK